MPSFHEEKVEPFGIVSSTRGIFSGAEAPTFLMVNQMVRNPHL